MKLTLGHFPQFTSDHVRLRISHKSKQLFADTQIYVPKSYFKNEKIKASYSNYKVLNSRLQAIKAGAVLHYSKTKCTPEQLKAHIEKTGFNSESSLYDFMIEKIQEIEDKGTRSAYMKYAEKLKEFGDVNLERFDLAYWENFTKFLSKTLAGSTANRYASGVLNFVRQAARLGLYEKNTEIFRLPKRGKTKTPVYLIEEEVELVKSAPESLYKDLFLFMYFALGRRVSCTLTLKNEHIRGNKIIYPLFKGRKKKPVHKEITITRSIQEILERYKGNGTYIFPFLENNFDVKSPAAGRKIDAKSAMIRKGFNHLMQELEIDKKVGSHTPRHTFARRIWLKRGNLRELQNSLDHESPTTTLRYIRGMAKEDNSLEFEDLL